MEVWHSDSDFIRQEPETDDFEIEEDLFDNEEINDDFTEDIEEAVEDFDAEDIEE